MAALKVGPTRVKMLLYVSIDSMDKVLDSTILARSEGT